MIALLAGAAAAQERGPASAFRTAPIPPRITCALTTPVDSFLFRNNVYVPTTFTVRVCVYNIDTLEADTVLVSLISNTRFTVFPPATRMFSARLAPGDSICGTFDCMITSRTYQEGDGLDTIRAVVTTSNGGSSTCGKTHWVEHEHLPAFSLSCDAPIKQIVWDDASNDYIPNPFVVNLDILNRGDNNADSTKVLLILPPGFSPDTTTGNDPVQFLGLLAPGDSRHLQWGIRTVKTYKDFCDTIRFQVQGKGGLGNKIVIDTCSVLICVQAARQAEYQLKCDYLPDSIRFINQRYTPDPFIYKFDVTNIGTADGRGVQAQVLLPPSITLVAPPPPNPNPINIGGLAKGETKSFQWRLSARPRTKLDTMVICMRVWDTFNNSDTCCDQIIIDSVRCGAFCVTVVCPDSIRVDSLNGIYTNNPFDLKFQVRNCGSDYIDSVRATMLVFDSDVNTLTPTAVVIGRLDPDSVANFSWTCKALPRAIGSNVKIQFKVESLLGSCADPVTAECQVYIPPLRAPNLNAQCVLVPPDTVRFDPDLLKYSPDTVLFKVIVTNNGGAPAEEVCVTPDIPPGFSILLGPTDSVTQCIQRPVSISRPDTVVWRLIPLQRTYGALLQFGATVVSKNATQVGCTSSVFVVAFPWVSAIAITQDNVGYYTQEIFAPVTIDQSDNKDIKDIDFEVAYDRSVVSFLRPETAGTLLRTWTVNAATTSAPAPSTTDTLHFHASNTDPLAGSGILLYLVFRAEFGAPPNELSVAKSDLQFVRNLAPRLPSFNAGSIFVKTTDGLATVSGACLRPMDASDRYIITQNRPNPFNPSTVIDYAVPEETRVRIEVMDALGRPVQTLVNGTKQKGYYQVTFDGSNLPSGMYFYRMETPKYTRIMKMILAR